MRLNTLEKLYLAMRDRRPEITMPEDIRVAALRPMSADVRDERLELFWG